MATQKQINAAIAKALEPFKGEKYEAERVLCERSAFIRKFECRTNPRLHTQSQGFITIVVDGTDQEIELPLTDAEAEAVVRGIKDGPPPRCRLILVEMPDV